MVKCAIKTCGLRKDDYNHALTLHRLPRNESEKKKWLAVIGADNINSNIKNPFICSMHFEESSFNRTLDVIRLRDYSMPSLYLQSPAPLQELSRPDRQAPANTLTPAGEPQRSYQQIKVTSGPSPKNRKTICSPSVDMKSEDHHLSDPLSEHPVPLGDALDPLGDALDPLGEEKVPPEDTQARVKDDTYLSCIQSNKISALSTRSRALNKKLRRYREVLRRRDRKIAHLQADVDSLRGILADHDRAAAGGAGAPTVQVLSSKEGVVKKDCSRQVLYIKRGATRLAPRSPDMLQKPVYSVVTSTDVRAKAPDGGIRSSVIRQNPPAGTPAPRTSVIRKTLPDIRQESSVGALPTLLVDVQRTSDMPANGLVIQIDGKHSSVQQPTLVRLHTAHVETG